MATVAASVAKGATVVPRLVVPAEGVASSEPSGSEKPSATSAPAAPLTADEAATLKQLMRGVVTEGGASFLQDVPGDEVAAKTGTAQFGEAGNLQNHVWMIAIQGDLAVAVFVDVGEYGSTTAGPLLEQFLRAAQG
jgi:cell division protein FtsI/penicillin-binding protein 2